MPAIALSLWRASLSLSLLLLLFVASCSTDQGHGLAGVGAGAGNGAGLAPQAGSMPAAGGSTPAAGGNSPDAGGSTAGSTAGSSGSSGASGAGGSGGTTGRATPPNIVFFLVDDMGWQDTSLPFLRDAAGAPVVTALNERYRTPNMEALAAQGMVFTNAYAMPVCSPTRVSLLTGKNSVRHHVTNWTDPDGGDTTQNNAPSHRSPTGWSRSGLPQSEITLPSLLEKAGYHTLLTGKAHFGSTDYAKDPLNLGFELNIAGSDIGHPGSYTGDYGQTTPRPVAGLEKYHNTDTFLTEALTLEMNAAIDVASQDGAPFYAYMTHYAVHGPVTADPRFTANYPGLSGAPRNYATMIEGMDKSLGDILAKLDTLGVAEETLVVFMSDNGGTSPLPVGEVNAPLRGQKGQGYEGGIRVPMIVAWAKPNPENPTQASLQIAPGSQTDDIVTCFDLYPTLLGAAGVTFAHQVDGYDLRPYLRGEPGSHRPQELLIHYPHDHNGQYYTVLRDGPWKLIYNYVPNTYELYNLDDDLSEKTDLAATQPARVNSMAQKMLTALTQEGVQWPVIKATGADDPLGLPR